MYKQKKYLQLTVIFLSAFIFFLTPFFFYAFAAFDLSLSSNSLPTYSIQEVTFSHPNEIVITNPYDPEDVDVQATITKPDNTTDHAIGFWYEEVQYDLLNTTDSLRVVPGSGVWKIRYAPQQVGVYQVSITIATPGGSLTSNPAVFTASASTNKGFLKTDSQNPTRLKRSDGSAFFAIGTNLSWPEIAPQTYSDHTIYATWLSTLKKHNYNFARVWIFKPGDICMPFVLEWTGTDTNCPNNNSYSYDGIGRYNQESAYQIDYILQQAQTNDIYLELVSTGYSAVGTMQVENPYTQFYTASNIKGFWTDANAIKYFKNYIRYLAARYGAYTSLGIVEFWNEYNNEQTNPLVLGSNGRTILGNWHTEMDNTLQASSSRPILSSTSSSTEARPTTDPDGLDSFNSMPTLDVTQAHWYVHSDVEALATWMQFAEYSRNIFNKPYWLGEYGDNGEDTYSGFKVPEWNRLNHHSTWIPIMLGGVAGSQHLWRLSYNYLPPQDFLTNTKIFTDWFNPELEHIPSMTFFSEDLNNASPAANVFVGGYKRSNRVIMYAWNQAAKWRLTDYQVSDATNVSYQLELDNGDYDVTYTNPFTGDPISTVSAQVTNGSLKLTFPTFKRDLAVKIITSTGGPTLTPTNTPTLTSTPTPTPTPVNSQIVVEIYEPVGEPVNYPSTASGFNMKSSGSYNGRSLSSMKVFFDGVVKKTCSWTTSACDAYISFSGVANGSHTLRVEGYRTGISPDGFDEVTICKGTCDATIPTPTSTPTITPTPTPTSVERSYFVEITTPLDGAVLSAGGSITASATADHQGNLQHIKIYVDGVEKKYCNYATNVCSVWLNLASGVHTIYATGHEKINPTNMSTSPAIQVTRR